MLTKHWQKGSNLIGIMIGLSIFAGLMLAALPNFSTWLHSAQVRTAAESLRDGLQFARMEAVRRNSPIEFRLPNADGTIDWEVGCSDALKSTTCPKVIQSRLNQEGSASARVSTATPAVDLATVAPDSPPLTLVFSGMGRLSEVGKDLPARLDIVSVTTTDARRLVLRLSQGGRVRLCDPAVDLDDSAGGCE